MFEQNGMIEAQNNEIIISDTSPECFRAMLEFFYTGKVTKGILETNVEGIFATSHKYQVELLKYECERIMSNLINNENFLKYCQIVSLYDAQTLGEGCKNFVLTNKKSFLNSKEWEEVQQTYPQLAIKFLQFIIDDSDNEK